MNDDADELESNVLSFFFFFCHWVTTQEQKFSFHFCFELLKATKITAALILANFIM